MRRAMSCVYCAPKSRMTMDCVTKVSLCGDWVSTNEFLKFGRQCKGNRGRAKSSRRDVACNVSLAMVRNATGRDVASYVSTARFGRSLRIGSSRSIVVCTGDADLGCGAGGTGAGDNNAWGVSAMHTYPARRAM